MVQEYATGPAVVPRGSSIARPDPGELTDALFYAMCHSQLTNDASATMSFSIIGMAVLLGLGATIVLISFSVDTVVGWLQLRYGMGLHARMEWYLNDKMEMQRLLYEEMGQGHWDDSKSVPVTAWEDRFRSMGGRELSRMDAKRTMSGAGDIVEMVQQVLIPKNDSQPH